MSRRAPNPPGASAETPVPRAARPVPGAPVDDRPVTPPFRLLIAALALPPALWTSFLLYQTGHAVVGLGLLLVVCAGVYAYTTARNPAWRYLFPGLLGFGVFVILPLVYTVGISFTRFDSTHLLSHDRVRAILLDETHRTGPEVFAHRLIELEEDRFQALFTDTADPDHRLLSEEFTLAPDFAGPGPGPVPLRTAREGDPLPGRMLELPEITRRGLFLPLREAAFSLPDGRLLGVVDLRHFAPMERLWEPRENGALANRRDGRIIRPDFELGRYLDQDGEAVGFGFRTWAGWENYRRIVTDPRIRAPFVRIFVWTVVFAGISVAATFALGLLLAVLLQWKELRGRHVYRTLLILPYAVPAVLSILIFQGLFNQEFGAVNELLRFLFGAAPDWNTNPTMARAMVLLVNLWLGYPYMMLICTGMLQSIPGDIYEASAIDGSGPVKNLVYITLPMILPPLLPLLIASFAFNFNNFNLIHLLTLGEPAMVGGGIAGETDILVTYTFSLAFRDSGSNYALASAIASILFVIVGALAWLNLKLSTRRTRLIPR